MRKNEEQQMLSEIADLTNLNDRETGFVESLTDQLDNGRGELTERQRKKLVEVYERRVLQWR